MGLKLNRAKHENSQAQSSKGPREGEGGLTLFAKAGRRKGKGRGVLPCLQRQVGAACITKLSKREQSPVKRHEAQTTHPESNNEDR